MDFAEALDFSKRFPSCHPKVFKGFVEWGIHDTETEGYVVLTDANAVCELSLEELEDYVETHNLRIDHAEDYLMICTNC